MRRLLCSGLLLSIAPFAAASDPLTFATSEPEFVENFTPARPMSRHALEEVVNRISKEEDFAIRRVPEGTSDTAVFGLLQFDRPVAFMIDPSFAKATNGEFKVFADTNRDGDLTNDPDIVISPAEAPFDKKKSWSVVVPEPAPGTASAKLILPEDVSLIYLFETQMRKGVIEIGGRSVEFALVGRRGVYDRPYNRLHLDVDGDGRIVHDDLGAEGVYEISERHLFLANRRYAFEVDRDGSSLTLTEAPEAAPPASVNRGSPAVDFDFVDIEGVEGTLADYKGNVVLLYFWGTWCGPCIQSMPRLAKTYHEFRPQGFEVLAIAKLSQPEDIRALMEKHDLDWRHVLEDDSGPLSTLYRIRGVPSYVLIDAEGTIVKRGHALHLGRELASLYAEKNRSNRIRRIKSGPVTPRRSGP